MDAVVRRLQPGEEMAFVRSERVPFLEPFTGEAEELAEDDLAARKLEVDRAWVAEDAGRFVANASIYSLDLTLPAAPGERRPLVPMAGISGVGVHPTHRRRGILRQLMAEMLSDAAERGEPLAGLTASESGIYGRFGFGMATMSLELSIDRRDAAFLSPAPELEVRLVGREEADQVLPAIFERQRLLRPGEPNRSPVMWEQILRDPKGRREGGFGMFHAVCEGGYVSYRAHDARVMQGERARLVVEELRGLTPEVEAALWRFVLDVDLVREVTARDRPVDEPLRWRLADPRRLRTVSLDDRLWLRVLDVPAALSARGYRRSGRLVLEVAGAPERPGGRADPAAGRFLLEAGPEGATCRAARPAETSDLRLGVAELGVLYLGGFPASELAAGGRLEELSPGALDTADTLFATRPAPFLGTGF